MSNNAPSKVWRPWEFQPPPAGQQSPELPSGGATLDDGQSSPFCSNPKYQDRSQQHQQPPSFGPIRTPRRHRTEADVPYTKYESPRMIPRDHSTNTHLGMAPMDAYYDSDVREASRPPTRNPSRKDWYNSRHQLIQMATRTWKSRTDRVNSSVDEIPLKSMLVCVDFVIHLDQLLHQQFLCSKCASTTHLVDMGKCCTTDTCCAANINLVTDIDIGDGPCGDTG